jgi:hypothetical protein
MVRTKTPTIQRTRYTTVEYKPIDPRLIPIPPPIRFGAGRPPLYESVEQLEKDILTYFESCWSTRIEVKTDINNNITRQEVPFQREPYMITGLACWLGMNRCTLLDYQNNNAEFTATINKAKSYIEHNAEKLLLTGKAPTAGVIFSISNNFTRWKDVRRTEHTGPEGTPLTSLLGTPNDERARATREQMLKDYGSGEDTTL